MSFFDDIYKDKIVEIDSISDKKVKSGLYRMEMKRKYIYLYIRNRKTPIKLEATHLLAVKFNNLNWEWFDDYIQINYNVETGNKFKDDFMENPKDFENPFEDLEEELEKQDKKEKKQTLEDLYKIVDQAYQELKEKHKNLSSGQPILKFDKYLGVSDRLANPIVTDYPEFDEWRLKNKKRYSVKDLHFYMLYDAGFLITPQKVAEQGNVYVTEKNVFYYKKDYKRFKDGKIDKYELNDYQRKLKEHRIIVLPINSVLNNKPKDVITKDDDFYMPDFEKLKNSLPNLKGSEKQIKWAEKIENEKLKMKEDTIKPSKKYGRKDVINSIKTLLGIDITPYIVDKDIKPRSFIFVDITNIDKNTLRDIIRVGLEYKIFTVQNSGIDTIAINFKNPDFKQYIGINYHNDII